MKLLLLFIIWLLLLGALKGLICICTLRVLCEACPCHRPCPRYASYICYVPEPQPVPESEPESQTETATQPVRNVHNNKATSIVPTFEGCLSFYWVSRAFCYPIILR